MQPLSWLPYPGLYNIQNFLNPSQVVQPQHPPPPAPLLHPQTPLLCPICACAILYNHWRGGLEGGGILHIEVPFLTQSIQG